MILFDLKYKYVNIISIYISYVILSLISRIFTLNSVNKLFFNMYSIY